MTGFGEELLVTGALLDRTLAEVVVVVDEDVEISVEVIVTMAVE